MSTWIRSPSAACALASQAQAREQGQGKISRESRSIADLQSNDVVRNIINCSAWLPVLFELTMGKALFGLAYSQSSMEARQMTRKQ